MLANEKNYDGQGNLRDKKIILKNLSRIERMVKKMSCQ